MRTFLATQQGFTFTEALLSLTLMGITVVPLLMALTGTVSSGSRGDEQAALMNAARSKLEEVLAMGFNNIPLSNPPGTPSALSDLVTIRGKSVSRHVIVDLADGDLPPNGVADPDLKRIIVAVGNVELYTYIAADLL